MKRRGATWFVLIAVVLSTLSLAPVTADQPDGMALVGIAWENQADLAVVETSGVPVNARLTGERGTYLLAGATSLEIEALQAEGLDVTVLDPDLHGASYFLAYPVPSLARPAWEAYGRLLLDDGMQVLLRSTPQDAERLADSNSRARLESSACEWTGLLLRLQRCCEQDRRNADAERLPGRAHHCLPPSRRVTSMANRRRRKSAGEVCSLRIHISAICSSDSKPASTSPTSPCSPRSSTST